jgi:hypothetical protein
MKVRSAFALCACLVFGTALGAQTTTLEYHGELMTGTSASLLNGSTGPDQEYLPLTTEPFEGRITGTLTVSGQPNSNDLALVSYNFFLTGEDGLRIGLYAGPAPLIYDGGTSNSFCGYDGCIDLTMLNNSFVGAALDLSDDTYHSDQSEFVVSPLGDSVFYLQASTQGTCQTEYFGSPNPDGSFTYNGPTVRDCSVDASNSDPGRWSVMKAPELDGTSALGALTLLLGSLAVLRKPGARPG